MKRSVDVKTMFVGVVLVVVAIVASSVVGVADDFSRKGKVEIFGMVQQFGSDSTTDTLPGEPIFMSIQGTTVGGFGLGGNLTDHFNLNTNFLFGSTTEDWNYLGYDLLEVDHTLAFWDVNLDYNFVKSRVTPVITGGIGVVRFSGWEESDFSTNVGFGVRIDVSDRIFIKGLYKGTWTKMKETSSHIFLDGGVGIFGFKF